MTKTHNYNFLKHLAVLLSFLVCSYLSYYFFFNFIIDYGTYDKQKNSMFGLILNNYPFYVLVLTSFVFLISLYYLLYKQNKNNGKEAKALIIFAVINYVFSIATIVVTVLKLSNNFLSALKNYGGLLPFFPYENLALPAVYILVSTICLIKGIRANKLKNFYTQKIKENNGLLVFLKSIVAVLFIAISSYYTGIVIFSYKTFPQTSDHFVMMIISYILFIVPLLELLTYLIISKKSYNVSYIVNTDSKKLRAQGIMSSVYFMISVGIIILYSIYEFKNPNFLTEELTNVFPGEHMLQKSFPLSMMILTALIMIPSFISLMNYLVNKRRIDKLTA